MPLLNLTHGEARQQLLASGKRFLDKATIYHGQLPFIRRLSLPALGIIGLLLFVNIIVWIAVGIVLVSSLISWSFGPKANALIGIQYVSK